MKRPATTAVHCDRCDTIFESDERDRFIDEIYCPSCSSRTLPEQRSVSVKKLCKQFPNASVYETNAALAA
jgi:DNA-directed RNA polymerase subunit RPC12/RpoP